MMTTSRATVPETLQRRRRLRYALLLLVAAVSTPLLAYGPSALRAVAVLGASVDMYDPTGLTKLVSYEVSIGERTLALPHRTLRSRRYAPRALAQPPLTLLLHGVHPRGIDEP